MERASKMTGNSGKTKGNSILRNNPISAWLRKRENEKQQRKEEAARIISNEKAQNEINIYNTLNSINFSSSLLPVEVLDRKTNEYQQFGDIETIIMQCSDMINNNTQDYSGINISKIDNGIYQLAMLAKQAIDAGNAKASLGACRALLVCIGDIRDKIPAIPGEMLADYLNNSEKYIDLWITYVSNCTTLDQEEKNNSVLQEKINSSTNQLNDEKRKMGQKIVEDPQYRKKIEDIQNMKYSDGGWTTEMIELYKALVDQRITESTIQFSMLEYNISMKRIAKLSGTLEKMNTKLISPPVATDRDLMNKYNDMLNDVYNEASNVDQEFDEFITSVNNMEAQIAQFENAPGSIKMKNIVRDKIEDLVEIARQKQLEDAGAIEEETKYGSKLQLYTDEQLQRIKQKSEELVRENHVSTNKNVIKHRERNTN